MAAEQAPAFQFYPKDFLTDGNVMEMTLTELGAYIKLLCLCWQECHLPADLNRLARRLKLTPAAFGKLWPAIEPCFRLSPDDPSRLIHPRLEKERAKQDAFRTEQRARGAIRAQTATRGLNGRYQPAEPPAGVQPKLQPESSRASSRASSQTPALPSSISDLRSPVRAEAPPAPTSRSKRPIFTGQRLTVFEWQLDDCARALGEHADGFDLHAWFYALDGQAVASGLVLPKRDGGEWLQAQLVAEAQRRGLPLRMATAAPPAGKLTTRLATAIANIEREEAAR